MSFNIGDSIGDYQIIGVLGAGGMGKVYKVKNVISDRVDALKILLPNLADDPELADRFTREIKVLASLNHPNIAGLRTAFRLDNQLLMVMEFVEGKTLDDRTKAGPIPVPDAINYITQALSALGYAHKQGIIHRDIKPANMMLTPDGIIKLMDFGIAKTKSDKKLTQTGTTMGSLFYMSAEQVQGNELDGRADLYSIGVSLYEMVTGARPFQGKSDFEIMVAQLQQAPLPPIQMVPNLPKALNDIILIAMEKDPAKRFQTAEAFSAALSSITNSLQSTPMQAVAGGSTYSPTGTQVFQSVPPAYGVPSASSSATGMMGAQASPAPSASGGTSPQAGAFLNTASTPTVLAPEPGYSSTSQGPELTPPPTSSHGLPPAQKSKSYTGLYMTLGALIVVGVLAFAAVAGTRFLKARASGDQASKVTTTATNNSPAGNPTNDSTQPPAGGASSPLAGSALPSGGQVNTDPNSSGQPGLESLSPGVDNPGSSSHNNSAAQGGETPQPPGKNRRQHGTQANMGGDPSSVSNPLPSGDQSNPTAGPTGNPQGGQPAAGSSTANTQELQELTDLHEKLSARAQSANDSVESLRKQMAAGGNNLRGDISASQTRMKIYIGKFEAALNSGDADSARKYMTLAEHEVDKLEAFLGH